MPPTTADADRALAARDPAKARTILETIVRQSPELDAWRKLAPLRRRDGDADGALAAAEAALGFAPLDFVSLLLRADLLDQRGDPEAGEAFGRALAQRPGQVPATVGAVLERGELVWRAHQDGLEARLRAAVNAHEAALQGVERARVARFVSNVSRRTRTYHSEPTHFAWPELREAEFHSRDAFPWLAEWEAATPLIAEEFAALVAAESAELVPYVRYEGAVPLAQWRELNHSDKWTSIHLIERGQRLDANARHCPRTMELLSRFPQPWIGGCGANAMFSLLAPHTKIPPHTGVANFRLVCHLPLRVPDGCWFRVGATTREWKIGEAWVFDDTIEHEAANDSDELRVIMIIDCWHPDLSAAEREAITAVVGETAFASAVL